MSCGKLGCGKLGCGKIKNEHRKIAIEYFVNEQAIQDRVERAD
ncbi:hypothetical protein [Methanosarcina sp. 1.H.A.2.2]|nr:hypothetical protein [Methanosarcina sp. 1.H.A.2.2]